MALAERAVALAPARPREARRLAEGVIGNATKQDLEAVAVAERALGLVARESHEIAAATAHFRRSVRAAEGAELPGRVGEARTHLALALLVAGDTGGAFREAERALAVLRGPASARVRVQLGFIVQRLGRFDDALRAYRLALPELRRAGDHSAEARVLTQRGVLHAYRGEPSAAERDLRAAEQLYRDLGEDVFVAYARHNRGWVAAQRGDIPSALALYDDAAARLRALGVVRVDTLLDRASALLAVGLVAEAREAADTTVALLRAGHADADLAEALIVASQAAARDGDPDAARDAAAAAGRLFVKQRRAGWAAAATHAWLDARWAGGERSRDLARAARGAIVALDEAGWHAAALDARLMAARLALGTGDATSARDLLAAASRARRARLADMRAAGWHAAALLRLADDDRRGAERALTSGLRILVEHGATLGSSELRASAAGRGQELSSAGLRLALDREDATSVLRWSERWRALALAPAQGRDVRRDTTLARLLAQLRHVAGEVARATGDELPSSHLLAEQARLEAAVRRRARQRVGAARVLAVDLAIAGLAASLRDRALVEFVQDGDALHAVTLVDGRLRLRRLGAVDRVATEVARLRFALGRITVGQGTAASRQAAADSLRATAEQLGAMLLRPLAGELADRELVIVPTAALHAMPWALVASCRGRPVSVSPSAALWHHLATSRRRGGTGVALVAGPGVTCAAAELRALRRLHPQAVVLSGQGATTERTKGALRAAGLAHIAAHGTFRADSPLFSSLRLADGPLTVYDIEDLRPGPRGVVLSACDVGLSDVAAGDALVGLAASLLANGSEWLVASVGPVSDQVAKETMVAFHRALRNGVAPAQALAGAPRDVASDGDLDALAAGAFVCFGAGHRAMWRQPRPDSIAGKCS